MSEEQKRENRQPSRHDFRHNAKNANLPKNRFGQTMLNSMGDENLLSADQMQIKINEEGTAVINASILESADQVIKNMVDAMGEEAVRNLLGDAYPLDTELVETPELPEITYSSILINEEEATPTYEAGSMEEFDQLISNLGKDNTPHNHRSTFEKFGGYGELADPEPVVREYTPQPVYSRRRSNTCINEGCACELPAGAKFCPDCGKPQLAKHCIGCGFKFQMNEKFCPDCGIPR